MKTSMSFTLILVLIIQASFAQGLNRQAEDPKSGKIVLTGPCDRKGLQEGEFAEFFTEYYNSYDPDNEVIRKIKAGKQGFRILIVLGTWCHDSKEQVPRFYNILDKVKWDPGTIEQICVNSSKEAEGIDISPYNIVKVPTFIFFRDGKEVGRIIETPVMSLEEDILMIIEG